MYWHLQVNFQFLFFKKKNINFSIYISDNIKNGLETDIDCTMGKLTIIICFNSINLKHAIDGSYCRKCQLNTLPPSKPTPAPTPPSTNEDNTDMTNNNFDTPGPTRKLCFKKSFRMFF